jgi:tetraacyldisaccharide 4'-kinase
MDWPLPIRILLWPFSLVYGLVVRYKTVFYRSGVFRQKRLNGMVVSVGNITMGGTGKTPMVLWLAEKFLGDGKSVAILSRGYRREGGSGDEVELMRKRLGKRVRFGVGADRFEQGSALEREKPVDIFLLDDGFQHLKLARDLDIVMLDGSKKLQDEWLLPAGTLREPVSACSRADLLVVTRKFVQPPIEANDSHEHRIFYSQTRLLGFRKWRKDANEGTEALNLNEIGPGPFFSFCGIGNPRGFADDLKRWHVPIAGSREFRDHHKYSVADVASLENAALARGAVGLVTTEKDEQNLRGTLNRLPVYVAVIDFVMSSESELATAIDRILSERQRVAS